MNMVEEILIATGTDFLWCVRTYKNRMRGQRTIQYKTRWCTRAKDSESHLSCRYPTSLSMS